MIRSTIAYLRPIAIPLLFVFLFQCCKAYDLRLTPLEEAVGPQKKYVKITTTDHKEFLFDSIYYKNDRLYGLLRKSTKKNLLEVELNEEQIKGVQIHVLNKEKSRRQTIMLIVIPGTFILIFGGFALIIANLTWSMQL
jgi:hypothetical protein